MSNHMPEVLHDGDKRFPYVEGTPLHETEEWRIEIKENVKQDIIARLKGESDE